MILLATKEGTSQGEREGHRTAMWSVHQQRPSSCNETYPRGRTLVLDFDRYEEGFEVGFGTEMEAEITVGIMVGFETGDDRN